MTAATDTTETIEFLKLILLKINQLQLDRNLVTVIADNHSANKAHLTKAFLQEQGLHLYFLPPMSSAMNPIEHCWSILKLRWSSFIGSLDFNYEFNQLQ